MDWVVDETQLQLMADADDDLQEFAGYATWCHDVYDQNLQSGNMRKGDYKQFESLVLLGLAQGEFQEVYLHPNLLCAFRYLIAAENDRDAIVPRRELVWKAMVEGIRLGTFN